MNANVRRLSLPGIDMFALRDGEIAFPADIIAGGGDGTRKESVNAFVLKFDKETVLVDAGCGADFADGTGRLAAALDACGMEAGNIDAVLLTHLHPDHVWGLLDANGAPAFPNAQIHVAGAEVEHWLDPAKRAAASDFVRPVHDGARQALDAYEGRVHRFDYGDKVRPGVDALAAVGHTPGHSAFLLKKQEILVVGDLVHFIPEQMDDPGAVNRFDADAERAVLSRRELLGKAADAGWLIAGMHLPFPGWGRVRQQDQGFVFAAIAGDEPASQHPYGMPLTEPRREGNAS